ncbi:trans-sialidase, partial [Trypanosoma conorhini]
NLAFAADKRRVRRPRSRKRLVPTFLQESAWVDEYRGVNATVAQGERRVPNGVTFRGAGAGAEWPVGQQGKQQLYGFARNKFTLAATVAIHAVPGADGPPFPPMGARMSNANGTVLFGLSYTSDKKWALTVNGKGREAAGGAWEKDKTYQVALRMRDLGNWRVDVDGEKIFERNSEGPLLKRGTMSHFYVGGDGAKAAADGHRVTVSNVLLYNRPLEEGDVRALAAGKVAIPPPDASSSPTTQAGGGSADGAASAASVANAASTAGPRPRSSMSDAAVHWRVPQVLLLLCCWSCAALRLFAECESVRVCRTRRSTPAAWFPINLLSEEASIIFFLPFFSPCSLASMLLLMLCW